MERLYTSNTSISNGNINSPIGKPLFAVNLPLKLFRATVDNADTKSLESLHTLFDMYLDHMLVKFEQNPMVRNIKKCELYDKKTGFFKTIFDKALTPFWKSFL